MSKKGHCFLLQVTRPSHSTFFKCTKRPCTQHTSTARGKSRTAVAIRKTARFQGLDCNRGRHATQRNSTNLPSDGDRGGPPFVLLAPRAPLFSSHPAIASPTPVSRLAWREKGWRARSGQATSRSREQLNSRGGRGKGEAWEARPRGSQSHRGCRARSKSLHLILDQASPSRRSLLPPPSGDPPRGLGAGWSLALCLRW